MPLALKSPLIEVLNNVISQEKNLPASSITKSEDF
jgi:hypothetical protein